MKSWHIPRRTFLRGAGVAMGLPLLDVMEPLAAAQSGESPFHFGSKSPSSSPSPSAAAGNWKAPVRMAILYMPNGACPNAWTPTGGSGPLVQLSPILEPLTKHQSDLVVLSEIANKPLEEHVGVHHTRAAGFLTCTCPSKDTPELNVKGISMDQIAAQKIGGLTPLPSLELSIDPISTGVDRQSGFSSAYTGYMSWSAPASPLAREIHPKAAFDRIFRTMSRGSQAFTADDRSVLDKVLEDARALRSKVSSADQKKLDEYMSSVRAVEVRIENEARSMAGQMAAMREARRPAVEETGRRLSASPDDSRGRFREVDTTERVKIMLDLVALAFWTDQTRIATFMVENEGSDRNFSFLPGVSGEFHNLSHHGGAADKLEQYKKINIWHAQQFAYLLDRMKQLKEGSRTLLDYSMVLFGSGMHEGNAHHANDLPLVLAGRGGGSILPGRHLKCPSNAPLANLWRSMLRRVGCPVASFADSTGELAGLDG